MPVETIKCRECGSAEVTEFKTGSYVCGHCEAIFKHVARGPGGAAGCEIDGCGVAAVGRCARCGRAFCGTHQGEVVEFGRHGWVRYVDPHHCELCHRKRSEKARRAAEEKEASERNAVRRMLDEKRRRLQSIEDPVERLVAAVSSLCTMSHGSARVSDKGITDEEMLSIWNHVCPKWPITPFSTESPTLRDLNTSPPWSSEDSRRIAQWFGSRARGEGLQPDSTARWVTNDRGRFGGRKRTQHEAPAWSFNARHGEYSHNYTMYVLTEGQLTSADGVFTADSLRRMGYLVGLTTTEYWEPDSETPRLGP